MLPEHTRVFVLMNSLGCEMREQSTVFDSRDDSQQLVRLMAQPPCAEKSSVFSERCFEQMFSRWMPRQTNDAEDGLAVGRGTRQTPGTPP
jgi:hypothetical protein